MYSNFSLEDLFFVSGLTHSEIRRGEQYPAINFQAFSAQRMICDLLDLQ